MHFLLPVVVLGGLVLVFGILLSKPSPAARRRRLREDLQAIQEEDRREEELRTGQDS